MLECGRKKIYKYGKQRCGSGSGIQNVLFWPADLILGMGKNPDPGSGISITDGFLKQVNFSKRIKYTVAYNTANN